MKRCVGKIAAVLATTLLIVAAPASALQITNAVAEPRSVETANSGPVKIRFSLSAPAQVSVNIYDGRDLLIRRIQPDAVLPAGDQQLTWDLRDQADRPVPPEAYRWTITATTPTGERVEYDLTDLSAAKEDLPVSDIKWDPETRAIGYRIRRPGRVNIRIGLANNGPILITVLDWVVRDAGSHQTPWNGKDQSGVLDLAEHPQLKIAVDAYALSDNSIIVGPPSDHVALIEDLPWGEQRRLANDTLRKRMHFHRQQPLESRGDYRITLTLPDDLPKDADGLPIITGIVPVRLDIAEAHRARALARRFEPVFFVDGSFAFENEVGFLPMTWRWDTVGTNPGIHYITANLRGYEGNFGIATLKVRVQRTGADSHKTQEQAP